MINSYSNTTRTLATNAPIIFDTNRITTGCTVTHTEGTPSFKLNRAGYYFVNFNCDISGATGDVGVQLLSNDISIPGAEASTTLAATTDTSNLNFSTIVKVLPSCSVIDNLQTLNFINTGLEATFTNVNVVITKLC